MFTAILSAITGLFGPVTQLVDKVSTTEQERLELRNALAKIQADMYNRMADLESKRMEVDGKLQEAQAGSNYWLVANWRPMVSIFLVGAIVVSAFMSKALPEQITQLAELFLGLHAGGRSIEKIAKTIKLGK